MKPKLILTIGSQGSGKSTWSKLFLNENNHNYVYISQDEQGKEQHHINFNNALKQKLNIIVDRCNFTKEQRMKYVVPAKDAGYEIEYRYFHVPYGVALSRIISREDHPTIKKDDVTTAKKALDMYFDKEEFETVKRECDSFISTQDRDTGLKVLDLTVEADKFNRVIVMSDIHGCFSEMEKALSKINYDCFTDMLIIIGDLSDRGEESDAVIRFCMYTPNVYVVLGNHDNKLRRWLRGNKVHTDSIQETIDQLTRSGMLTESKKDDLYAWMMDMPYIIKIGLNYFAHAGFNPNVHPEDTTREFCMYARYFDEKMGTFTRESSAGYWFDKPRKYADYRLFFGHIVIEDINKAIVHPKTSEERAIVGLDGGMCFGEKTRYTILTKDEDGWFNNFIVSEFDSSIPKKQKVDEWDHMNKFETYDKLVEQGYLRKQEKGALVLYNYTEKCTYEKYWNKYTMECRGLILNKETGDTVARPLNKFFNEFELENKSLPQPPTNEPFVMEEKLDGSLGICYLDPFDDKYKIATRGSFESDQAKIGTTMFQDAYYAVTDEEKRNRIHAVLKRYTPCFEIIYPENRFNDGARLVVDYGSDKTLVLLAAINKETGKDLDEELLAEFGDDLGFRLRKTYLYSKEEVLELQKTWPVNFEGVVMRYANGFRIKYKGSEYCKMQKILNSISPLSIWEQMKDTYEKHGHFLLTDKYKEIIPEEILKEVEDIESKLISEKKLLHEQALHYYGRAKKWADEHHPNNTLKGLGLYTQKIEQSNLAGLVFARYEFNLDKMNRTLIKLIRPKGNEL